MNQSTDSQSTSTKARPSTPAEIASHLRAEAHKNPAFSAMCHVFAMRERARNQVTVNSLRQTMERENFTFTREQYAESLKKLAALGLGKLDTDSKGKVQALKDIKVTLQSIGHVAVGKREKLENFKRRNTFIDLPQPKVPVAIQQVKVPAATVKEVTYPITILVSVQGEDLKFPLNFKLTGGQIAALIQNLQAEAVLK